MLETMGLGWRLERFNKIRSNLALFKRSMIGTKHLGILKGKK
jgi:hypothetical protein